LFLFKDYEEGIERDMILSAN